MSTTINLNKDGKQYFITVLSDDGDHNSEDTLNIMHDIRGFLHDQYHCEPAIDWNEAPEWANVLLRNRNNPESYCWAVDHKDWASGREIGKKPILNLISHCWEVVEWSPALQDEFDLFISEMNTLRYYQHKPQLEVGKLNFADQYHPLEWVMAPGIPNIFYPYPLLCSLHNMWVRRLEQIAPELLQAPLSRAVGGMIQSGVHEMETSVRRS